MELGPDLGPHKIRAEPTPLIQSRTGVSFWLARPARQLAAEDPDTASALASRPGGADAIAALARNHRPAIPGDDADASPPEPGGEKGLRAALAQEKAAELGRLIGEAARILGCCDTGMEAAGVVLRAGLLRLGGSMLGEVLPRLPATAGLAPIRQAEDRSDEFIMAVAGELNAGTPINYQARRAALSSWELDEETWQHLVAEARTRTGGRCLAQGPHDVIDRLAASVAIWQRATHGFYRRRTDRVLVPDRVGRADLTIKAAQVMARPAGT